MSGQHRPIRGTRPNSPMAATRTRSASMSAGILLPNPGRGASRSNSDHIPRHRTMTTIAKTKYHGAMTRIGRSAFILFVLSLAACSEDFLERKPKGQLTFDTFFETQDHA